MDARLVGGMRLQFMEKLCTDVGTVDGVNPKDGSWCRICGQGVLLDAGGAGCADCDWNSIMHLGCRDAGTVTRKDCGGKQFGEVMGTASVLACEVSAVVLAQEGLAVDADEWVNRECGEVGVTREVTFLPSVVFSAVGLAVKIDVHGDFMVLMCLTWFYRLQR